MIKFFFESEFNLFVGRTLKPKFHWEVLLQEFLSIKHPLMLYDHYKVEYQDRYQLIVHDEHALP